RGLRVGQGVPRPAHGGGGRGAPRVRLRRQRGLPLPRAPAGSGRARAHPAPPALLVVPGRAAPLAAPAEAPRRRAGPARPALAGLRPCPGRVSRRFPVAPSGRSPRLRPRLARPRGDMPAPATAGPGHRPRHPEPAAPLIPGAGPYGAAVTAGRRHRRAPPSPVSRGRRRPARTSRPAGRPIKVRSAFRLRRPYLVYVDAVLRGEPHEVVEPARVHLDPVVIALCLGPPYLLTHLVEARAQLSGELAHLPSTALPQRRLWDRWE